MGHGAEVVKMGFDRPLKKAIKELNLKSKKVYSMEQAVGKNLVRLVQIRDDHSRDVLTEYVSKRILLEIVTTIIGYKIIESEVEELT